MLKLVKKHFLKPLLCLTIVFSIVIYAPATITFADDTSARSLLQISINYAESLTEEDNNGTEEDWTNLQVAIEEAKDVVANPDATEEELKDADRNLTDKLLKVDFIVIRISDLEELVALAKTIPTPPNPDIWWGYFQDSLKTAKDVLANPDAISEDDLMSVYFALLGSMENLINVDFDLPAKLQSLIDESATLKENDYTAESWAAYQASIKEAKDVLNDKEADGVDRFIAYTNLEIAKAGLVKVTPTPSSSSPASSKPAASSKTTSPKTGDNAAISIATLGVLVAAAIILKKRKIFY